MGVRRSYEELVDTVAQLYQIASTYDDIYGVRHIVPRRSKVALLKAMGIDADTAEGLEAALLEDERRQWACLVPPVLVADMNRLLREGILLHVLGKSSHASPPRLAEAKVVSLTLRDSFGTTRDLPLPDEDGLQWQAEKLLQGVWYQRYRMKWKEPLECGYFWLSLTVEGPCGTASSEMALVICPEKAYVPVEVRSGRQYVGIYVPVFSIRSSRKWGMGDLADLREFAQWAVSALGIDFIGTNPLHATSNQPPYGISPYYPSSRIFRNFVYLSIEEIPEFVESLDAQEAYERIRADSSWVHMCEDSRVDFQRVAEKKRCVLEMLFKVFMERHWARRTEGDPRAERFVRYLAERGDTLEWTATFFAIEEHVSARNSAMVPWDQWPDAYKNRFSSEVRAFRDAHRERILFYQYLQWLLDEQLHAVGQALSEKGLSMGLYLDMALGVDPWGADRWVFQELFASGATAGAPPDDFSPHGQDWGIAPFIPHRLRETGYKAFIETVRENVRHAGMLRIDHVMGLFRLFWIPQGCSPADGAYVKMPAEEMLGIVLLESYRNGVVVIGEDLGTVPHYIRERLKDVGVLSSKLFFFEKKPDGTWKRACEYPQEALAAVTTHDLPTLRGFWDERDIRIREQLSLFFDSQTRDRLREQRRADKEAIVMVLREEGLLPHGYSDGEKGFNEDLQRAIIGFLLKTPCWFIVLNYDDIFLGLDQLNLPGTSTEYPNWTARLQYSLEDLARDPLVAEKIASVCDAIKRRRFIYST